jgi:putative phosphoribosyl transferase
VFTDRADAGRRLAGKLAFLRGSEFVVLGLPRGGVPVAFEVARELAAPLDVIVVRKLGLPAQPELAMGAVGEGGVRILNREVVRRAWVAAEDLTAVEDRERQELARQALQFRADRSRVDIGGRTALVVDDGIATGSTAWAACQVAREQGAARVIMAAPVGAPGSARSLLGACDQVICLHTPASFASVGEWYADFAPVPDAEVAALLRRAAAGPTEPGRASPPPTSPPPTSPQTTSPQTTSPQPTSPTPASPASASPGPISPAPAWPEHASR